ncbi:hypothetical protein OAO87_01370 [bacterium]|nr:hypothetical protein [bacterium]
MQAPWLDANGTFAATPVAPQFAVAGCTDPTRIRPGSDSIRLQPDSYDRGRPRAASPRRARCEGLRRVRLCGRRNGRQAGRGCAQHRGGTGVSPALRWWVLDAEGASMPRGHAASEALIGPHPA